MGGTNQSRHEMMVDAVIQALESQHASVGDGLIVLIGMAVHVTNSLPTDQAMQIASLMEDRAAKIRALHGPARGNA